MTFRPLLVLGTAVLAASATTMASGAPAGAAEPTTSASVSNGKLKRVDAIELRAESLVFERGDHTVADVSMRDARSTVNLLNRLLGTPARTHTAEGEGGACFPAGTTYTWGGAIRVAALTTPADLGNAVEIRVLRDEVRTRTGTTVELSGPDGVQVGDDVARRIERADSADRMSFGADDADDPTAWQVLLERGWDGSAPGDDTRPGEDPRSEAYSGDDRRSTTAPDDAATDDGAPDGEAPDVGNNGVSAITDDTTVTVLGSPMPINASSGC